MAATRLAPIAGGAFILGIIAANLNWSLFFLLATVFVAGAILKEAVRIKYSCLVFAVFSICGFLYGVIFANWISANYILPDGKISGKVVSDIQISGRYQYFRAELSASGRGEVRVRAGAVPVFDYGDRFELTGAWDKRGNNKNTPLFAAEKLEIQTKSSDLNVKQKLYRFKQRLTGMFRRYLPIDSAALAGGITLGETSGFSYGLKEDMKNSGTTRLVALSGYNISLVATVISSIFGFWLGRRKSFWPTCFFIIIFTVMTGAASSVVRAATMGLLMLLAGQVGRFYDPERALIFAAVIMLIFNPLLFRNDLGFSLSFLSFAGLAYLEPVLKRWFGWTKIEKLGAWRENLLHTLSAQMAVLPLLLIYLGSFSLTSFLANVLVLGITPLVMFFGFLSLGAGLIIDFMGQIMSWLLNPMIIYQLTVIHIFSTWSTRVNPVNILGPWPVYALSAWLIILAVKEKLALRRHA